MFNEGVAQLVEQSKKYPVILRPSSPIGMRRLSQKENRIGSSPILGTRDCYFSGRISH